MSSGKGKFADCTQVCEHSIINRGTNPRGTRRLRVGWRGFGGFGLNFEQVEFEVSYWIFNIHVYLEGNMD